VSRVAIFGFSLLAYAGFGASLLYLLAFLAGWAPNYWTAAGVQTVAVLAVAGNLGLLFVFGAQHSVMARPAFKAWWTRWVPAAIERSVYVLVSSVLTALVCWYWLPLPWTVWAATSAAGLVAGWGVLVLGVVVLIASSFDIDHWGLLGVRQGWAALRGATPAAPAFLVRGFYRLVRHPIYVGWLLIFWGTPHMSGGRFVLAMGMTLYVLIAIRFEERDLIGELGEDYRAYRSQVPALVPRLARRPRSGAAPRPQ
jgi:methanethiol S-methyltransferase